MVSLAGGSGCQVVRREDNDEEAELSNGEGGSRIFNLLESAVLFAEVYPISRCESGIPRRLELPILFGGAFGYCFYRVVLF